MILKTLLRVPLVLLLAIMLALGSVGCDEDSATDPGGTPSGTDYSDATVVAIGVPTAISQTNLLVNSAVLAAGGIGGFRQGDGYVWDEEAQAWVLDLSNIYNGTGSITVQYLSGGTPVMDLDDADTVNVVLDLDYSIPSGSSNVDLSYDFDVDITGMDSGTLTIIGGGSYVYTVSVEGIPGSQTYTGSWVTVASSHVTIPEDGGCPTGQILWTMGDYEMLITMDGSSTASYLTTDSNGDPVDDGSGTFELPCSSE